MPSYKIYEDEQVLAFLDIKPINPGHVLVIPKKHYPFVGETPDTELQAVVLAAKKIGNLMKQKLDITGYSLLTFGRDVPHFHLHVIPWEGRTNFGSFSHGEYQPGEAEEMVKKLKN